MKAFGKILVGLGLVWVLASCAAPASDAGPPAGAGTGAQTTQGGSSGMKFSEDVALGACKPQDATNWLIADLTITNHSSKASNYMVTVAFEDKAGNQLGTGIASADHLEPGQSKPTQALSTTEAPAGAEFTCKVADITRYAA